MYYVNDNIKELYRIKCQDKRSNILRLDMNENPEGLPLEYVDKIKKKITPEFLATYPEKDELIKLIANQNDIVCECISVTNGSDEAMRLIFQCFGENGKNVVTVYPTFEMYAVYSKMFGMNHVMVEFDEDFNVSVDEIISRIDDDTGMVVLLNPNSPIGRAFDIVDVKRILEKARDYGALVVIDEAYHYFYENTFIKLIEEYDNLLVLRTFSKVFSIAGLRIGYVVGNMQLIKYIENAESTYNVNSVAILFAEELLKNEQLLLSLIEIEKEGHDWLAGKMLENNYQVFSEHGNYILFKPKAKTSGEIVLELKKKNIWVRDYSKSAAKGWVRVSTGSKSVMNRFFEALIEVDV